LLQQRLDIQSRHLCWPRGKYDEALIQKAQIYYDLLYTVERGINLPGKSLDRIKRIAAKGDQWWLRKQLLIFSNDFVGKLYARIKPK